MLMLLNSSKQQLKNYILRQVANFFPDGAEEELRAMLDKHLDHSLLRLHRCINAVKMWRQDEFDYLHSSQYTIFLYYLSNTIWRMEANRTVCNKLFYLNKCLNGIDLFYEIEMPEVFFIGHSVGLVLAKASYGNYLVLYQNSTIGKNHGHAPVLGEGVIVYPNSAIIGACHIEDRVVIAQGTSVIDRDVPANSICFNGMAGDLHIKQARHVYLEDYFRL